MPFEFSQRRCRLRGPGKLEQAGGYLKIEVPAMRLRPRTVEISVWLPCQTECFLGLSGEPKIAYRMISRYDSQCEIFVIRSDGTRPPTGSRQFFKGPVVEVDRAVLSRNVNIDELAEPDDCSRMVQVLPPDRPTVGSTGFFSTLQMSLEGKLEEFGLGERGVVTTITLPDDPDRILRIVGDVQKVVTSEHARGHRLVDV